MQNLPKVDILIPTYNRQNTIIHSVYSALSQINVKSIVHVIDNNSSDNTLDLLKNEFKAYLNVTLFIHEYSVTVSMIDNWNRCLTKVSCEYFKFLFSDDILSEEFCHKTIRHLINNDEIGMICTDFKYFESNIHSIGKRRKYFSGLRSCNNVLFYTLISRNKIGAPSNTIFKSKQLNDLQFLQNPVAADMIFFFSLIEDKMVLYVNEELAFFRFSGETVTNKLKLTKDWIEQNYLARNILIGKLKYSHEKKMARFFTLVYCMVVLNIIKYEKNENYMDSFNYLNGKLCFGMKIINVFFSILLKLIFFRKKILKL